MPSQTLSIVASADDGNELSNGNVQVTATNFNPDQTGEWIGLRFVLTAAIPAGSTVVNSKVSAIPVSSTVDEPDTTWFGEDTATPAQYVAGTATFTISTRSRTTASVNYASTDLGATGSSVHDTPSLNAIFQELIDSYAPYSVGQAMALLITSRANDATRDYDIALFDHATLDPPVLFLEWTEPGASGQPMALRQSNLRRGVARIGRGY